jgi:hypothetical protein
MLRRAIVLVVVVLSGTVHARSVAPPPQAKALAGTWIGLTGDDLTFFRLRLDEGGGGLCASTFVREAAVLYRVTRWSIQEYDIEIGLEPVDEKAESIFLRGTADGWQLYLTVGGTSGAWSRELKMRREEDMLARLERTRERMRQRGGGAAARPVSGDAIAPRPPPAPTCRHEAKAPDLAEPAGLARAVFEVLRCGDAEGYTDLTVSRREDFAAVAKLIQHIRIPDESRLASIRRKRAGKFRLFLGALRARGIDPARARIVRIVTDRAKVQGDLGFAEDITLVLGQGDTEVPVTLDDCPRTPRGWLIMDGLRLRK